MISVLLPTYNQAKFLPDALAGLAEQTRRDFEVIACDDGSTDETWDILNAPSSLSLRSIRLPENRGTANAINAAAGIADPKRPYMTWVSSDNRMHPEWLEVLAGELDRRPDVGAVYSAFNWCEGDGSHPIRQGPYHRDALIGTENCYFGPSFLIRREVWQEHRGLGSHDYENWTRVEEACWARGMTLAYVDVALCDYRVGGWQTVRKYPERYDAGKWQREAIQRRCTTPAIPLTT